jgi:transglutaminase-like putative cysteine protease
MACANAVGLAARFVSGYYFDEDPKLPSLHAWVEVYIPGGGWRGFDPSLGLACYGHHIALASSASAAGAAPIHGIFRGNAQSEMKLELEYKYSPMPVVSEAG